MKTYIFDKLRVWLAVAEIVLGSVILFAQYGFPVPDPGSGCKPNAGVFGVPGSGFNPGPPPNFRNQGVIKVIANGYDATGVWQVLPLMVSYQYNGVQYEVNVLNAWNPWTDQWDKGVDVPAYNTNYVLRNITYDFYTVLSFGTFYFNL